RGLASRLFAAASVGCCDILSGGCSVTQDEVLSNVLAETTASCTCEPASGRKERLASGPGFQPSRRRLLRTAFSLRPRRPAIQRLLISLALRRRLVRSRSWSFLRTGERTSGRPLGRARALSPPA